jgi:hypothetical protein
LALPDISLQNLSVFDGLEEGPKDENRGKFRRKGIGAKKNCLAKPSDSLNWVFGGCLVFGFAKQVYTLLRCM